MLHHHHHHHQQQQQQPHANTLPNGTQREQASPEAFPGSSSSASSSLTINDDLGQVTEVLSKLLQDDETRTRLAQAVLSVLRDNTRNQGEVPGLLPGPQDDDPLLQRSSYPEETTSHPGIRGTPGAAPLGAPPRAAGTTAGNSSSTAASATRTAGRRAVSERTQEKISPARRATEQRGTLGTSSETSGAPPKPQQSPPVASGGKPAPTMSRPARGGKIATTTTTANREQLPESSASPTNGSIAGGASALQRPTAPETPVPTASKPTSSNKVQASVPGRTQSRSAEHEQEHEGEADGSKRCQECGTQSTPGWRRGPEGKGTLCNACGLRWAGSRNKDDWFVHRMTRSRSRPESDERGTRQQQKLSKKRQLEEEEEDYAADDAVNHHAPDEKKRKTLFDDEEHVEDEAENDAEEKDGGRNGEKRTGMGSSHSSLLAGRSTSSATSPEPPKTVAAVAVWIMENKKWKWGWRCLAALHREDGEQGGVHHQSCLLNANRECKNLMCAGHCRDHGGCNLPRHQRHHQSSNASSGC